MIKPQVFLKLIEGKDVADKEVAAYCNMQLQGMSKHKTAVAPKSRDPKWDEKSLIWGLEEGQKEITIVVKGSGLLGKTLGQVTFSVDALADGVPHDQWYPLESRPGKADKVRGEIHMQIMYSDRPDGGITDADFKLPIHTLIAKQKQKELEAFLSKEKAAEFLDKQNETGETPLHIACSKLDNHEATAALLKKGAKTEICNAHSQTPLHYASEFSPQSAAHLVAAKANIEAESNEGDIKKKRPLHVAAVTNNAKAVAILLDAGAEINAQTARGDTALVLALKQRCNETMKVLSEKGADPYIKNKDNEHACDVAMKIGGDLQHMFMDVINVEDDREFALHDAGFVRRHRYEGASLFYEWQNSNQFLLQTADDKKVQVRIIVHFIGTGLPLDQASRVGFALLSTVEGVHKEMSYQTNCQGFGTIEPYELELEPGKMFAILPYASEPDTKGKFSLLIYTKGEDIKVNELLPWKFHTTATGAWKESSAGGAYQGNNPWRKNPHFLLRLPAGVSSKSKLTCYIMLEQEKSPLDIIAFVTRPYAFHVGFYLFDKDVEDMKHRSVWQNAREVFKTIELDPVADRELVIVPTTFKPAQETAFVVHVYSDEEFQLEPYSPPKVVDVA